MEQERRSSHPFKPMTVPDEDAQRFPGIPVELPEMLRDYFSKAPIPAYEGGLDGAVNLVTSSHAQRGREEVIGLLASLRDQQRSR